MKGWHGFAAQEVSGMGDLQHRRERKRLGRERPLPVDGPLRLAAHHSAGVRPVSPSPVSPLPTHAIADCHTIRVEVTAKALGEHMITHHQILLSAMAGLINTPELAQDSCRSSSNASIVVLI